MGHCDELEGLRHLLLAAILDTLSSTEKAMEHFRLSVQHGLNNPDEMCVPAFALYELGLLLTGSEEVGELSTPLRSMRKTEIDNNTLLAFFLIPHVGECIYFHDFFFFFLPGYWCLIHTFFSLADITGRKKVSGRCARQLPGI